MASTATISKAHGQAFVIRDGQETQLSAGDELLVSDSVRTGLDSGCELLFADGTQVQLGPLTQINIQDFAFNADAPAENSFAVHMMEGVVNTVSGEVVKLNPEGFSLSTPLGTAGIRGTTVLAHVFPTHVVFMVTDMAQGHSVHINNIFGNSLTILQPGKGVELSLDGQSELKSFDFLPQDLKDLLLKFMENDNSGSESQHFFLYGDADFLAALGATPLDENVGMLVAQDEDIIIALLAEFGVEEPEFFLEGPPEGPGDPKAGSTVTLGDDPKAGSTFTLGGDASPNWLVPGEDLYGPEYKDMNYVISGYAGDDVIVTHNGQDVVYGGQGSFDQIFKISDAITDGNVLVGGEDTLGSKPALDNDVIVLRALGASVDTENGWTSTTSADYGATVMSGGLVYGSARILEGCGGGANQISLYGTMAGGAIYGNAESANNSILGNATITVNRGLDADGNLVGGDMTGGTIYGDASSMNGGTAGSDSIEVGSLGGSAVIYGDAASGAYTAGNNIINVTGTMSGGAIYAGNGDDQVKIGFYSGGTINLGDGNDALTISAHEAGATLLLGNVADTVSLAGTPPANIDISSVTTAATLDASGVGSLHIGTLSNTITLTSAPGTLNIDSIDNAGNIIAFVQSTDTISLMSIGNHSATGLLNFYTSEFQGAIANVIYQSGAGDNAVQFRAVGGAGTSSTFTLSEGKDLVEMKVLLGGTYNVNALSGEHWISLGRCDATSAPTFNLDAAAGSTLKCSAAGEINTSAASRPNFTLTGDGAFELTGGSRLPYGKITVQNSSSFSLKVDTPYSLYNNIYIEQKGAAGTSNISCASAQYITVSDAGGEFGRGKCTFRADGSISNSTFNLTKGQNDLRFTSLDTQHSTFKIALGQYDDTVAIDLGSNTKYWNIALGAGADSLKVYKVGPTNPATKGTIDLGSDNDADTIDLSGATYDAAEGTTASIAVDGVSAGKIDVVNLGSRWSLSDETGSTYTLQYESTGRYLVLEASDNLSFIGGYIP